MQGRDRQEEQEKNKIQEMLHKSSMKWQTYKQRRWKGNTHCEVGQLSFHIEKITVK